MPRDIAVVKAAAEAARWEPRPSPRPDRSGDTLTGRGIAYAQRSGAVVAIVAEVEIDRRTGKIRAKKFTVARDCGLIINPDRLRRCIEGNVVQGTSRALSEEVTFDRAKVTGTDWLSYPILDSTEAPEADRADQPFRTAARRRRRKLDPPARRGHRQRRLRCHRCAPAPRPAPAGATEAGADVGLGGPIRAARIPGSTSVLRE